MRAIHDRLTALEQRIAVLDDAGVQSASAELIARVMRLASRIHPPTDPETLELVATGDTEDILKSEEAIRVACEISALLANGESE